MFVLPLYDTECTAVTTTTERFRLLDRGPPTICTGKKALLQLHPFFFFPAPALFLLLLPKPLLLVLCMFL